MGISIYEINQQLRDLLDESYNANCIDMETGEILPNKVNAEFDRLISDRNTKLETVALWVKDLEAESAAIKAEERILKQRREGKENKVESLRAYLAYNLHMFGDRKFETPKTVLSFKKSSAVEVPDISLLDKNYISEKIEYNPNKTAIKDAIKQGVQVVGAYLVEKENLQIK